MTNKYNNEKNGEHKAEETGIIMMAIFFTWSVLVSIIAMTLFIKEKNKNN